MDTWQCVWLSVAGIGILYLLAHFLILHLASNELSDSRSVRKTDDCIEIYAKAESLEYYIRCALSASDGAKLRIVVNISKDDVKRDEMMAIVETMRRSHKNVSYRLI